MSETIIELKQNNINTDVVQNGIFNVTLDTSILISKNDTINLKSCFIDTISENEGKIVIPKEFQDITFTFGLYLQDQPTTIQLAKDAKTYYNLVANTEEKASNTRPNGQNYILCSKDPGPNHLSVPVAMQKYTSFELRDKESGRVIRDKHMRGFLQYKDSAGVIKPYNFVVSSKEFLKLVHHQQQDGVIMNNPAQFEAPPPLPIVCQRDAWGPNTPMRVNPAVVNSEGTGQDNFNRGNFIFVSMLGGTPLTGNNIYNPWLFDVTIHIPANAYEPLKLTELMTKELNNALGVDNTIPLNDISRNNLLQSLTQLRARGVTQNADPIVAQNPYWVSEDATDALTYAGNANNYLFGASGFEFGYDPETNLASIDSMHSSVYSGNQTAIVPFQKNGKQFVINKTGGIFMTACSYSDLLTIGLNLPPTIFTAETGSRTGDIGTLQNSTFFTFDLQDGLNVTGMQVFNDAMISKGSVSTGGVKTFDVAPLYAIDQPTYGTLNGIVSTQINNILARAPIGANPEADDDSTPYYQIEIDSNFTLNKVSNGLNSKKIMAVVNKYYSVNSFTIGDSSMSSMYIHDSDEPTLIKNFSVRILDPDGNEIDPAVIQDNNVIFLSVMQNPVIPNPPK